MFDTNFLLRAYIFGLFFVYIVYWRILEKASDREKPKNTMQAARFSKEKIGGYLYRCVIFFLFIQVGGVSFFPLQRDQVKIQIIGAIIATIGLSISIMGRKTLGTNWAHAREFQIKQKQELVTKGIYSSIRHPIYSGISLLLIGGELVALSWLAVFLAPVLFLGAYIQGKREEKILINHFGDKYKRYMKKTKMLIPFVF